MHFIIEENLAPIIIFGSSRNNGSTWKAMQMVLKDNAADIINLNNLNFSGFDYDFKNQNDDFVPLAEKMMAHDIIVLAAPVYWYSMIAIMKKFVDRWTDPLMTKKVLGRKFRGKTLYSITSYDSHTDRRKGFEPIFKQIANYFGMTYGGTLICYFGELKEVSDKNESLASEFSKRVFD